MRILALLAFGLSLFSRPAGARDQAPDSPRRPAVLVTGFGSFRGVEVNAAELIVSRHLSRALAACREEADFELRAPVAVEQDAVERLAEEGNYRIVISLGVIPGVGRDSIRVERIARNRFDDGRRDPVPVLEDGRASRAIAPLPAGIAAPITAGGRSFRVSFGNEFSCDTYVCNATLYRGLASGRDQHFLHIENVPADDHAAYAEAIAGVICRIVSARLAPQEGPRLAEEARYRRARRAGFVSRRHRR